jgi:hypothetical protein
MEALSSLFFSLSLFISGLFGGPSNAQISETPLPKRAHRPVVVADMSKEVVSTSTVISFSTTTALLYVNKKYNFTLELPKSWEGYRVKEIKPNVFSFGLKDQDAIFSIVVMSKKEWQAIEDESEKTDAPIPTKLLESDKSDKHVFAYTKSQDVTDTAFLFRKDIDGIVSSLTLQSLDKNTLFFNPFGDRVSQTTIVNGDPIATISKDFPGQRIIYTKKDKSKVYFALYRETGGQECVDLSYLDTIKSKYMNTKLDYCPGYDDSPVSEVIKKQALPLLVQYGKFDSEKLYALNLETEKEIVIYLNKNDTESLIAKCTEGMYDFVYVQDIESTGNKQLRIGVYKEEGQRKENCLKEEKYTKIRNDYIDLTKFQ